MTLEEGVADMPGGTRFLIALFVPAITALSFGASAATAKSVPVDVRVYAPGRGDLASQRQYTAPTTVRTSRRALCFGEGTGGSGNRVDVAGPTPASTLIDASANNAKLSPLSISDHDFGFAAFSVCGIGSAGVDGSNYWFIKVNHKAAQVGSDQITAKKGDKVEWFLIPYTACSSDPPYACLPEMVIEAPARARPGVPFGVRVVGYDDNGVEGPMADVAVSGSSEKTDARGRTQVTLSRTRSLRTTYARALPAEPAGVCVSATLSDCPKARGFVIRGSKKNDRIAGTNGPDRVRTGPGDNRVNVRGGGTDLVRCGNGENKVIADRRDVVRGCTKVIRK